MAENYSYETLEGAIRAARANTAIFYRVDLHVHTINSHDFPSTHSKKGFVTSIPSDEKNLRANESEFKQRFVQRAKEQRLQLVAITDHNESDMAEQLAAMSDGELTVLPGIEISVQTNLFPESEIHIIGIFPQGTTSKEIDKVFPPNCGMPPSGKRGGGVATSQPIAEILQTIRQLNGLSIAAHVSGSNGIRAMVHSQNVEWLQKNYLRRYLKGRKSKNDLTADELVYLQKLNDELKPLDDEVQNAYLMFLADHDFNAIQVQEGDDQQYYMGAHVEMINLSPFPCVLSSDAHTLADLGCYRHGTHVKMTKVGLDGLRKALLDPGTRIRYDTNVPVAKPKRILGVSFEGGSLDKQAVGFSDNLTTLIGGRGTGKSALIEAMRFVLGQEINNLPDHLRKDIEERRDYTLRNTEVKLLFADEQSGEVIVVKRRLGEARSSCFTLEGKALPEIDLPKSPKIHAEIYGWNEIEALSDSPRKQLGLLDRTIPGIDSLTIDLHNKIERLRENNDQILSLVREVHNLLPHTQGAAELRKELDRLNTPELNDAFASFDQNDKGLRSVRDLVKEANANRDFLLDKNQPRDLKKSLIDALETSKKDLGDYPWFSELSQIIEQGADNIQMLYNQLLKELRTINEKIAGAAELLEEEHNNIEAQLNSIAEKSGQSDFKTALSRRKELTEKLSMVSGIERDIEEKEHQVEKLLVLRRTEVVPALMEARKKVYDARLEKSQSIANKLSQLKAASGVGIQIEQLGDKDAFSRALGYRDGQKYEGLFQKIDKQYLSKDYPGFYACKFSPHEFVSLLLEEISMCSALEIRFIRERGEYSNKIVRIVEGRVETQGSDLIEYNADGTVMGEWPTVDFEFVVMDDSQKIWKHLSPLFYENETNKHYDPQKLENLLGLELTDIEDRPRILLDGRPIEELSPGQRCSALIPIILVEGNTPLVIDQPEDNLDNRMVFDLVVDILRGLKEQRQIIVATHNPNIPVSGDAEQVVVFEAPSKDCCCAVAQGSIDEENIIKNIKAVMEGGDKAFEVRMKKYGVLRGR